MAEYSASSATCFAVLSRMATERLRATSASPALDAALLLAAVAGTSRSSILAHPERELDGAAHERFRALVEQRATGVPLAYALGYREFFELRVEVTNAVLVPRPETELLVEAVLDLIPDQPTTIASPTCVLDLASGSGAIALALKHARPWVTVTAADVSPAALEVARANAMQLGLQVEWVQSNWFAALDGRCFDVIVCNPPYVASDDPHFDGPLRFEPRLALDGGPDGLDAYRHVLAAAPAHLAAGGRLLFEHGYDQRTALLELGAAAGFRAVDTRADFGGHERCVGFILR